MTLENLDDDLFPIPEVDGDPGELDPSFTLDEFYEGVL